MRSRLLKKAHLLRWRPRPHAQRTESTPRVRPSGAASHLGLFEPPALVDTLRLAFPLLVAQHELLHLARRGLGEIAELDGRGRLEVGDVLLAELDDVLLAGALTGLEGDKSLGPLAPLLVGNGNHGALHHRGVLGHALLHLDGRDVLAPGDDDVLLRVPKLDVAVGMPYSDIARVKPAAPERLGGGVGLLEVSHGAV